MSRSSLQRAPERNRTAPAGVCAALPDFLGRTALTLIAALPAGARVLLLVDAHVAVVNHGRISGAQFMRALVDGADRLPFVDRTFDCVVLDAPQLEAGLDGAPRPDECAGILTEVRRVLRPHGELVLVTEHRRVPQNWRQLHRYRLVPPDRRWATALASGGYQVASPYYADLDALRLTGLTGSAEGSAEESRSAGYKVIRCSQNARPAPAVLDTILETAATQLNAGALDIQRIAIRKIGKTSITAADRSGRRYVIRVPRSAVAASRARRNYAALQALASDERFPRALRNLVPRPVLSMTVADYHCYVEEAVAGSEVQPSLPAGEIWHGQAADFVTTLHTRSRIGVVVDEAVYQRIFAAPLATVRRHCDSDRSREAIDRLERSIRASVEGYTLPMAWTHGDFFLGNCLSDAGGHLTGVVDWELFSTAGLPLLDLLQLMIVPGETSSHPTWQRFDRICGFITAPSDLYRWPVVARYLDMMDVPAACVPGLLRMFWVDHVANRIAPRSSDANWMRKRVYQPLEALDHLDGVPFATVPV